MPDDAKRLGAALNRSVQHNGRRLTTAGRAKLAAIATFCDAGAFEIIRPPDENRAKAEVPGRLSGRRSDRLVDEIATPWNEGRAEVRGFASTKHEQFQLIKYWYRTAREMEFRW
jgi:hypothetical protein